MSANVRFRVDLESESLYRIEMLNPDIMPMPVVGDLVKIERRMLLVISRVIDVTTDFGPWVTIHLDPGSKRPFSKTGWMIMEDTDGEG